METLLAVRLILNFNEHFNPYTGTENTTDHAITQENIQLAGVSTRIFDF